MVRGYLILFFIIIFQFSCYSQQFVSINDDRIYDALNDFIDKECSSMSKRTGCITISNISENIFEIWFQCDEYVVMNNLPLFYAIVKNYPILFNNTYYRVDKADMNKKFKKIILSSFFYGSYEKVKWKVILKEDTYMLLERTTF